MKSFEALRESIRNAGVKSVASEMNLSSSLVYKWCEANDESSAGAENPLDRIVKICRVTGDELPISWLCRQVGGFLVKNPSNAEANVTPVLKATQAILKEFSEVLEVVSKSIDDDGGIGEDEANKIRAEWEQLKEATESFVLSCEHGVYRKGEEQ